MAPTPEPETYTLPPTAPFANHGRTRAGWTLMVGVCLGFLLAGVGLAVSVQPLVIAGVVVAVGSLVVSQVMRAMGMGQPATHAGEHEEQDWYGATAVESPGH
ncbi:MAG: HGxxPAAW family protein [Georgenia sp.]